jgi:two-component system, LuxR family, response regulator FixJ
MVFVIDDDASVRGGLERLFRAAGIPAQMLSSAREFLERDPHHGPGCIVLDLKMPDLDGLALQQALADNGCDLPIVFLTGHGDVPASVQALKRGAADFLTKPVDEAVLLDTVHRAIEGHRALYSERLGADAVRARVATLSARELEVMRLVVTGLLNKQIGLRLGIAEKTVKVHRGRVMQKMNARSVPELVRLCTTAGVEPACD